MTLEAHRAALVAKKEELLHAISAHNGAIEILDVLIKERDAPQESPPPEAKQSVTPRIKKK